MQNIGQSMDISNDEGVKKGRLLWGKRIKAKKMPM